MVPGARQAIKDPYVFDFLTMSGDAAEHDLERVGTPSPQFQVQAGQVLPIPETCP
jgi:predicted nuclease of restriction endonuclease-like (RecB) superfamily